MSNDPGWKEMIVSLSPQQENMDVAHEFCEGEGGLEGETYWKIALGTETCSDRLREEGRDGSRPKQRYKQPCACSAAVEEAVCVITANDTSASVLQHKTAATAAGNIKKKTPIQNMRKAESKRKRDTEQKNE